MPSSCLLVELVAAAYVHVMPGEYVGALGSILPAAHSLCPGPLNLSSILLLRKWHDRNWLTGTAETLGAPWVGGTGLGREGQ